MLTTSKGLFEMDGILFDAPGLLRRMGTFIAFYGRPEFIVSSKGEMALLECGLGHPLSLKDEDNYSYVIAEPMVHEALLNYLNRNNLLELSLRELMARSKNDASCMGRLWEKLFTIHI
jgi:hypothetical protein